VSYPRDLDEMGIQELQDELSRRYQLFRSRKCTYCERPWNTMPTCRFPQRHQGASQ